MITYDNLLQASYDSSEDFSLLDQEFKISKLQKVNQILEVELEALKRKSDLEIEILEITKKNKLLEQQILQRQLESLQK